MNLPTLYISGPMTGLPEFNFPAFHEAAKTLRDAGYTVLNPAESEERETWLDYMRHDVKLIADCDGIVSLEGWGNSRGATIEHALASMLGIPADTVDGWELKVRFTVNCPIGGAA